MTVFFAVALRQPKLSEMVLKEVEEVHYNLDKSLEFLPSTNMYKGISHQQFVLSSANKLADFFNVQSDMNMSMNSSSGGKGKPKPGQGSGQQLSDIIEKQKVLVKKNEDGLPKPGDGKKPGQGNKPNDVGKSVWVLLATTVKAMLVNY